MNIAWLSNPPYTYSGYAVQSKYFINKLQADGHKVVCVVNRGLEDGPAMTINGIYCFPGGHGHWIGDNFHWGWRGLLTVVKKWKPDIAFSLFDVWTFPANLGELIENEGSLWTPITPVDHDPIPPIVWARIKDLKFPIAMSKFGQEMMKKAGVQDPKYIPHAIDTKIWRPASPDPKVRDSMGGRDNFTIGIVAANRSYYDRKAWAENLKAVGIFQKKHKDTNLYIHTIPTTLDGGLDLTEMCKLFETKYAAPDTWQMIEGFPDYRMVEIYNCFDVMLLCSRGEGFGIPLIEAQACGVPVIATNFSTGKELCSSGWLVEPKSMVVDEQYAYQTIPDVDQIVERLEQAYSAWKDGSIAEKKMEARKFAMGYDIDLIYDRYMKPLMDDVMRYKALPKKKVKKKNGKK